MRWRVLARAGVIGVYLTLGWMIGLACIAVAVFRLARFIFRLVAALRPTVRCPDGHASPVYARWRCHGHVYDGWGFRCPVCGEWAGHIDCATCGLAISSPLVRE